MYVVGLEKCANSKLTNIARCAESVSLHLVNADNY